jgi:hypothetical protein
MYFPVFLADIFICLFGHWHMDDYLLYFFSISLSFVQLFAQMVYKI